MREHNYISTRTCHCRYSNAYCHDAAEILQYSARRSRRGQPTVPQQANLDKEERIYSHQNWTFRKYISAVTVTVRP